MKLVGRVTKSLIPRLAFFPFFLSFSPLSLLTVRFPFFFLRFPLVCSLVPLPAARHSLFLCLFLHDANEYISLGSVFIRPNGRI